MLENSRSCRKTPKREKSQNSCLKLEIIIFINTKMGEANVPNKDVYKEFEKLLKPIKSVEVSTCETRDSNKASPQY